MRWMWLAGLVACGGADDGDDDGATGPLGGTETSADGAEVGSSDTGTVDTLATGDSGTTPHEPVVPVDGYVAEHSAPYAYCTAESYLAPTGDRLQSAEYDGYGWPLGWATREDQTAFTYVRGPDGRVTEATRVFTRTAGPSSDDCRDTVMSGTYTHRYDEHQHLLSITGSQTDACGTVEAVSTVYTLTHDGDRLATSEYVDDGVEGVIHYDDCESIEETTFRGGGLPAMTQTFENDYEAGTCTLLRRRSYFDEFYEDGRLVWMELEGRPYIETVYTCP